MGRLIDRKQLDDGVLAAELARHAGRILLAVRAANLINGKTLGTVGDQVSNRFLMDALKAHRPDDKILSEESRDTRARLSASRVWIIDPVDGTREYGENRTDWAVHVGLAIDGKPAVGAVALPGLDLVLRSDQPVPLPEPEGKLRILVSRTRPAPQALAVARALNADLVPMGSAGAKAMAIIRGEADIYLHSGGQHEWDSCAPVSVAQAHGLHCSRIDATPLHYNNQDTYLPDLLVCHKQLARQVLDLIRSY